MSISSPSDPIGSIHDEKEESDAMRGSIPIPNTLQVVPHPSSGLPNPPNIPLPPPPSSVGLDKKRFRHRSASAGSPVTDFQKESAKLLSSTHYQVDPRIDDDGELLAEYAWQPPVPTPLTSNWYDENRVRVEKFSEWEKCMELDKGGRSGSLRVGKFDTSDGGGGNGRSYIQGIPSSKHAIDESDNVASIKVVVRKRPLSKSEGLREADVIDRVNNYTLLVHEPKIKVDLTKYVESHQFMYDEVFDDSFTTADIYRVTTQDMVNSIFYGKKATCFAYGQTGSG
jgi:hypothetical protein